MNAFATSAEFAIMPLPETQWLVLRCANQSTLRLAESLNEAGIEAWTPADDGVAMTTRYVFARARHFAELLDLTHNPFMTYRVWDSERQRMVEKGHPYFSLLRDPVSGTGWAIVRDTQLDALRMIEKRRKPRGVVKAIPVGATVRLDEGGFAGLDGVVQSVRNKFAMVAFAGFPVPVQIGCWLLTEKVDDSAGNR